MSNETTRPPGNNGPDQRSYDQYPRPSMQMQIRLWLIGAAFLAVYWLFSNGVGLYTDWLWFGSVGYENVFTTELAARVAIFVSVALIFMFLFLLNVYIARWLVKRNMLFFSDETLVAQRTITYAAWGIALLLAWLVGSTASSNWLTVLQYLNRVPFEQADPIFGQDISFYVFSLPLLNFIQGWTVIVLFLSLFGTAGIYILEQRNNLEEGRIVILPHVQLHLSILGALIFVVFAWGHWLDTFDLMYSPRGVVFGASYTDINVVLPVLRILMGVAVFSAVILLANIFIRRNALPLAAIFIWLIGGFLLRGVAPGVVQRFVVDPNELTREEPYINYNIQFTNRAYNLDNVDERSFTNFRELSEADLIENTLAIQNIRLWDYRPMLETFQQLQALRLYYTFLDVDLDRYYINDEYRQVALSVRELDKSQLQSQTWINQKLQFTHGYGIVVNPVNEITREGLPNLWVKDFPPQATVPLTVTRPEIYFGENTTDYVFVNTNEPEVNYPGDGDQVVYTNYAGDGGVVLNNFFNRLMFALRFADSNIILSNDINLESKVLLNRQIQQRVQEIAPFLSYDPDPYIVIGSDGRLYWIQDAYTTSNLYPYSTRANGQLNYIRNSVKIVIDPYHGSVDFYLFDENDPLVQTINQVFPGLFKPGSELPEILRPHLRYPEGIFSIQADLYRTYHMRDPKVFYNQEDLWAIPLEKFYGNSNQPVEPYYLITRLPNEEQEEFILIQPFTPFNKNNLIAWMAARSDGENYGQLVVYRFSKQELVFGPQQIEARIDQDPEISPQFTLWDQGGSEVIRGNLLILPLAETLLYVEPIYLQAETGEIPELKQVILASGDQVVMEENLPLALASLLGGLPEAVAEDIQTGTLLETNGNVEENGLSSTARQLAESASANYQAAKSAIEAGDWAGYGEALNALEADLDELLLVIDPDETNID